jgi:cytochrome c
MSDLGFNKIAGAVLATGLAVVGLHLVSEAVFEPHVTTKPGYAVTIAEETGGGSAAAELPVDWGTVLPTADVAAGQAQFAKCASCHQPTDANGTGPGLNGIVGRKPAAHAGFAYSPAMVAHGAEYPQWTYDELDAFLKAPQKHIPGTKMTFVGLKKQEDRINIIAYLHTLASSLPIPAPDPSRAAGAAAPAPGAAPEGAPVATGETGQAGQPGQAPGAGPAAAPTQVRVPAETGGHR